MLAHSWGAVMVFLCVHRDMRSGFRSDYNALDRASWVWCLSAGWALGSVVEHRLHTAGVSGSNPLAPTNLLAVSTL